MAYSLRRTFSCHVELALEILNGKWKPVILGHLKQGALRFSELSTLIPALSDKMLAAAPEGSRGARPGDARQARWARRALPI